MNLTVHIDLPAAFCVSPRQVSLSWGYCKILFDILLLLLSGVLTVSLIILMIYDERFDRYFTTGLVVSTIMTTSVIVDIAFHTSLLIGTHKKKVNHLKAFCKYTKALCILTPLLIILYIIVYRKVVYWSYELEANHLDDQLLIFTYITSIAIIFQIFIMLAVITEIKNVEENNDDIICGSTKIFKTNINLEIKTCSTEKLIENTKAEAETETTHNKKEKLPL